MTNDQIFIIIGNIMVATAMRDNKTFCAAIGLVYVAAALVVVFTKI
jgi:hypothetical protein